MRKGSSIIGLKVISQADGTDLGKVKDLVFDHETDELLALVISEKDLFGLIDAQVVPWSQVQNLGTDAIIVQNSDSKIAAGDDARVKDVMDRETVLSGTKIYTTDGRDIGTFADMYIDEQTGRVVGYEVSGGFVTDTMSGKRFIPAPQEISIGKDVALVPPTVAADLEAQKQQEPGGLQAVTASVGEKVSGAYDTAREKVGETYSNIAEASVEKQKEFVVGKTAVRDVIIPADKAIMASATATSEIPSATTPSIGTTTLATSDISSSGEVVDGEVLVHKGEIITAEHANRAEAAGILGQLVVAATGGAASEAYASGREKVSGVAASGSSAAQERAEEAAIGKPAGREVVAPNGSIIVAPGMIITREILTLARLHGKEREVIAAAGAGAASQGVETVKESAGGVWETIKHKAAELTGAAHDKKAEYDVQAEQAKINNALGRPTTRVILDQSDHVILNAGELITHAAIDQARAAGALDILLDSVYVVDPEITPEMLRAREHGQAAIESEADAQSAQTSSTSDGSGKVLPPAAPDQFVPGTPT